MKKDQSTVKAQFQELQTERLVLRAPKMDDTQPLLDLISDPIVYKWIATDGASMTFVKEQVYIASWIAKLSKPTNDFFWVVELEGELIGTVGFHINHKSNPHRAVICYMINPQYWGKGYITEAVKEIVSFAFSIDGLTSLQIDAFAQNVGSHKVALKCGFKEDGVLREYYQKGDQMLDMHVFSLLKSEYLER